KRCSHCNTTSTPYWRREPTTLLPLCNACGLYMQQRHKPRPQELIDADFQTDEPAGEEEGPQCSHCQTRRTCVWRRSKAGTRLCNACGVYARLRGKDRPLHLKGNKIRPRTRH
ncbi:GATA transcription factor, partial [Fistulina hepatica ATCC 64428]